jgi:hypothetical protein
LKENVWLVAYISQHFLVEGFENTFHISYFLDEKKKVHINDRDYDAKLI